MGAEQVNIQPSQNKNHQMPGVPGIPKGKPAGIITDRNVVQGIVSAQIALTDPNAALKELEATVPITAPDPIIGGGSTSPGVATADALPKKAGRPSKRTSAHMPIQGPDRHGDEPDPPPSTMRQYEREQRELDGPRPEITEIFANMVAPHMPPTGFVGQPVQYQALPTNDKPLETVIIKHEVPSMADAYQFTEQVLAYIGSPGQEQLVTFKPGQILNMADNADLIEELISKGTSSLIPIAATQGFHTCPKCHHHFLPGSNPQPIDPIPPQYYMNSQPQVRPQ